MRPYLLSAILAFLVGAPSTWSEARDPYRAPRERMIHEIRADVQRTRHQIGKKRLSGSVMKALATVPRHEFVPKKHLREAYENHPLPIGHGQTISQPYIVALMTDLLEPDPNDAILEVGTGSGYQAAILAEIVQKVFTMEIIRPLFEKAKKRLITLGYRNIDPGFGDGYYGLPQHAPYDGIMVTAASRIIPPPLIRQLKPGGKMIIPVGSPFMTQQLTLIEKNRDGGITTRQVLPVIFVPLTGGH